MEALPPQVLNTTLGEVAIWVTFIVMVVSGITWFRKTVSPFFKKIRLFLEDWNGEDARPGVPRRPGINERLSVVERMLEPDHGSSIYDKVSFTAEQQAVHATQLQELANELDKVKKEVKGDGQ